MTEMYFIFVSNENLSTNLWNNWSVLGFIIKKTPLAHKQDMDGLVVGKLTGFITLAALLFYNLWAHYRGLILRAHRARALLPEQALMKLWRASSEWQQQRWSCSATFEAMTFSPKLSNLFSFSDFLPHLSWSSRSFFSVEPSSCNEARLKNWVSSLCWPTWPWCTAFTDRRPPPSGWPTRWSRPAPSAEVPAEADWEGFEPRFSVSTRRRRPPCSTRSFPKSPIFRPGTSGPGNMTRRSCWLSSATRWSTIWPFLVQP